MAESRGWKILKLKGILIYNKVLKRFTTSSRRVWKEYLKKLIAKNFLELMEDNPTNPNQDK